MEINQTSSNKLATTLNLTGRLDATSCGALETTLEKYRSRGSLNIILNLKDLEYVSSAGLGSLLSAAKALDRDGGNLILCEMRENIRKVFDVSGFTRIFDIMETEADAKNSLASSS